MRNRLRLFAAIGCAAAAAILPFLFLTVTRKHLTPLEMLAHVNPHGLIIKLGNSGAGQDWLDGIYARPGMTSFESSLGGMILPLCLLLAALLLLVLGARRR